MLSDAWPNRPPALNRDGEIEARSPVSLIFEGAVADFAETVKEQLNRSERREQRVSPLSLFAPVLQVWLGICRALILYY